MTRACLFIAASLVANYVAWVFVYWSFPLDFAAMQIGPRSFYLVSQVVLSWAFFMAHLVTE